MEQTAVTVWILGDQLLARHPALVTAAARYPRAAIHVVLVESAARTRQMAYQRKRLVARPSPVGPDRARASLS